MVPFPSLFYKLLSPVLAHYICGCIFSQDSIAPFKSTLGAWGHREPRRLLKGLQTPILVKIQWKCLDAVGIHRTA